MLKALSENKLASGLMLAYIVAMTGGVITATIINFAQDGRHIDEVGRSKGVDKTQEERITFGIGLALEARDMALKNGAAVGIHHNNTNHH